MTQLSSTHSEQRTHERFSANTRLIVIGPGGKEYQSDHSPVNLSEGGLLFYAKSELKTGISVEVHIEFPGFNSSIEVGGRIMWTQRATQRPGEYFAGIQFIGIEEADQELIADIRLKDEQKQSR